MKMVVYAAPASAMLTCNDESNQFKWTYTPTYNSYNSQV